MPTVIAECGNLLVTQGPCQAAVAAAAQGVEGVEVEVPGVKVSEETGCMLTGLGVSCQSTSSAEVLTQWLVHAGNKACEAA
jgi:hypothetical protein